MCPLSGLMSPSVSFRTVLLPAPAIPKSALVSPRARRNETPSSTTLPSNAMETSSKTTTYREESCTARAGFSAGNVCESMASAIGQEHHEQPGNKEVHHQNENRSGNHGLSRGPANALSSAASREPVIAAHRRDNEAEQHRLHQSHEDVLENQGLPGIAPILASVEAEQNSSHHRSAG